MLVDIALYTPVSVFIRLNAQGETVGWRKWKFRYIHNFNKHCQIVLQEVGSSSCPQHTHGDTCSRNICVQVSVWMVCNIPKGVIAYCMERVCFILSGTDKLASKVAAPFCIPSSSG